MQVLVREVVEVTPASGDPLNLVKTRILAGGAFTSEQLVVDNAAGCVRVTITFSTDI